MIPLRKWFILVTKYFSEDVYLLSGCILVLLVTYTVVYLLCFKFWIVSDAILLLISSSSSHMFVVIEAPTWFPFF
jgi:hypothetical protein